MSFDLNNFLAYDGSVTASLYYGYAYPGTPTASAAWLIRNVTTSANVQYTTWTNNDSTSYESVWNDRSSCFTTPSWAGISITYSSYIGPFIDLQNTIPYIDISWSGLTGVSRYTSVITDGSKLVSNYGNCAINTYNYAPQPVSTRFRLTNVLLGVTYSVTITAINAVSSTYSTVNIKVGGYASIPFTLTAITDATMNAALLAEEAIGEGHLVDVNSTTTPYKVSGTNSGF